MTNEERAKTVIKKISYITVATVSEDGMPWNAPVFAAYDENYNFYWGTYRDSQKSKNIRHNKNVYLVIYDSNDPPGEGFGVYIKATAEELTVVSVIFKSYRFTMCDVEQALWVREVLLQG